MISCSDLSSCSLLLLAMVLLIEVLPKVAHGLPAVESRSRFVCPGSALLKLLSTVGGGVVYLWRVWKPIKAFVGSCDVGSCDVSPAKQISNSTTKASCQVSLACNHSC